MSELLSYQEYQAIAASIDMPETIQTILWHAEAIDKIYDQTAPAGDKVCGYLTEDSVQSAKVLIGGETQAGCYVLPTAKRRCGQRGQFGQEP